MEREKRQEQLEVRGAETERAAVEVEGLEGGEGGCRGGSGAAEVRPRGEDGGGCGRWGSRRGEREGG